MNRSGLRARTLVCLLAAGAFFLAVSATVLWAETIVVGSAVTGDAYPFGTSVYSGAEYQQVYSSSAFSGPIDITQIGFAPADLESYSLNVIVSLGYSSVGLNSLSADYLSNEGADFATVFSGNETVSTLVEGEFGLFFNLTTPFDYNPAQGDLLLDVFVTSSGATSPDFFEAGSNSDESSVFSPGGNGAPDVDAGYGLETQFVGNPVATPEPSSLVLVGTALLGVAGAVVFWGRVLPGRKLD